MRSESCIGGVATRSTISRWGCWKECAFRRIAAAAKIEKEGGGGVMEGELRKEGKGAGMAAVVMDEVMRGVGGKSEQH